MNANDFRRIALRLSGAEESSHMGSPDFRVGGRIFATLAAQDKGYGNLMLDPEQQSAFVEELPDVFLPVAGCYGEPSSGNPAFQAARTFGLPALWQLPETNGVLSCEAWRHGKIAIGTEYLGAGQLSADGVRDYRNGIAACLAAWGVLISDPHVPKTPDVFTGDWELASASGIFTASCRIGDLVTKGTTLAVITGTRGQVLQEFVSTCDGAYAPQPVRWAVTAGFGVGSASQGFPDGTNARRLQLGLRFIW